MNLAAWAERDGVARVSAYRWFRAGLLPVPGWRVGRLVLVREPIGEAGPRACTLLALLRDASVTRIVVGYRDRSCRAAAQKRAERVLVAAAATQVRGVG